MKPEELIGKTVEILNMCGAMPNSNSFPFNIGAKLKVKNAEEDNPALCLWFEGTPIKWHTTYDCIRICEDDYDTLVQEALKRYPAGTIVNSLYRSRPHLTVDGIIGDCTEQDWVEKRIWMNTTDVYRALVYSDGEWAEIVSPSSVSSEPLQETKKEKLRGQALLDEANRKYPLGTKYKALLYNGSEGTIETSMRHASFVHNNYDDNYVDVGTDYVYINGMWADVVQPADFLDSKKSVRSGDWIRITKSCGGYVEPGNFCKVSGLTVGSERYDISGQWYRSDGTPLLKLSQSARLEAFEKVDTPSWYKSETNESKPSFNTNPLKENIIAEISRRYPIGTQYIPLSMAGEEMDTPFTVLMDNVSVGGGEGLGWVSQGYNSGFVYHRGTGKWARIVKEATVEEKPSALTTYPNTHSDQNSIPPTTEQKHITSESPLFPDQCLNKESELKIISKDKTLDTSVPEEVKLNGDVQEESQHFYF